MTTHMMASSYSVSQGRVYGARSTRARPAGRSPTFRVQALFGWGQKDAAKEAEKEEAFRAQQELLQRRKTGEAIKEANVRRAKVKETVQAKKDLRRQEKEALAKGVMPETYANWKPYQEKKDEEANSGIVVPLLPFGIRKYDEGERFDLRSPYADDGWVDPSETDMFSGFKNIGNKLLNLSGRNLDQQGKPIIWASEYEKQMKQGKQGRQAQKDAGSQDNTTGREQSA